MKILAIDTATEACSAALLCDGNVQHRYTVEPRAHTRLILPMVDELLAESELKLQQLDAIAFGRGPGAFTGIRIAAGVTQGLALGADLPVVPVSNLAALAVRAFREMGAKHCIAAIDARMQEVYWGAFSTAAASDGGTVAAIESAEAVLSPQSVPWPATGKWMLAGTGWQAYEDELVAPSTIETAVLAGDQLPHAQDILSLAIPEFVQGSAVDAALALPVYLRDKVTN